MGSSRLERSPAGAAIWETEPAGAPRCRLGGDGILAGHPPRVLRPCTGVTAPPMGGRCEQAN
jgi:hypothetical protein